MIFLAVVVAIVSTISTTMATFLFEQLLDEVCTTKAVLRQYFIYLSVFKIGNIT